MKELIGKEIYEIRTLVSRYKYDGNIPLESIDIELLLSSKEIISFPLHPNTDLSIKEKFKPNLNKIYPQSKISKLFSKSSRLEKLKNQKIKGIWAITDDFGDEKCSIEFQNGSFLSNGSMSPIGTGEADLHFFESKQELEIKYQVRIEKKDPHFGEANTSKNV